MIDYERGNESVQFVIAVPLLLAVVFATIQIGGMMLSTSRLSADIVRAGRHMNAGELDLAADKDEFVKNEIVHLSDQLVEDNLTVDHTTCSSIGDDEVQPVQGEGSIMRHVRRTAVSFDVSYEMPSIALLPGLSGRRITRHVECERADGKIFEVRVGSS